MDSLQKLVEKLKENNYNQITCVAFNINNFVLKIKNSYNENECESLIYGVLESNKKSLSIEEYSYTLTTFEKLFLEFCKEAYHESLDTESEYNGQFKVELWVKFNYF